MTAQLWDENCHSCCYKSGQLFLDRPMAQCALCNSGLASSLHGWVGLAESLIAANSWAQYKSGCLRLESAVIFASEVGSFDCLAGHCAVNSGWTQLGGGCLWSAVDKDFPPASNVLRQSDSTISVGQHQSFIQLNNVTLSV